jgi:hypothetical protein
MYSRLLSLCNVWNIDSYPRELHTSSKLCIEDAHVAYVLQKLEEYLLFVSFQQTEGTAEKEG